MRITTNMMRRKYEFGLNNTLSILDKTRTQVETGRRFTEAHEEPLAASKAIMLEHRYARNADYKKTLEYTMDWQETQESAVMEVNKAIEVIDKEYSMEALNNSNADLRNHYATSIRNMQEQMVYSLNCKMGDVYVLAGENGSEPPFQIQDGKVTFQGVDISDPQNEEILKELANEEVFVDIGFGINTKEDGTLDPSTAFNTAYSGLKLTGFEFDSEGKSTNVLVLAGEMADMLEAETFDEEAYKKAWMQLSDGKANVEKGFIEMGSKSEFMETTLERLEGEELAIIEQYDNTVNIDEAKAIMDFSYAQYVQNLTLKMGTNILTPSLLDFLR